MARSSHSRSPGRNLSGYVSRLLDAYADRLVLLTALDSHGALGRSFQVPLLRVTSRFLAWWSRGWVGQVLGWGWSVATFSLGFRNRLGLAELGDDWEQFRDGNVKPRPRGGRSA